MGGEAHKHNNAFMKDTTSVGVVVAGSSHGPEAWLSPVGAHSTTRELANHQISTNALSLIAEHAVKPLKTQSATMGRGGHRHLRHLPEPPTPQLWNHQPRLVAAIMFRSPQGGSHLRHSVARLAVVGARHNRSDPAKKGQIRLSPTPCHRCRDHASGYRALYVVCQKKSGVVCMLLHLTSPNQNILPCRTFLGQKCGGQFVSHLWQAVA